MNKLLVCFILVSYQIITSVCELRKSEIKNIHKNIPKPPKDLQNRDHWITWKRDIDLYNNHIWSVSPDYVKKFENMSDVSTDMKECSQDIDDYLSFQNKLTFKQNLKTFHQMVRGYYYYSLRIVSTLQTLESDSVPQLHGLPDLEGPSISEFVDEVLPKLREILKEITDLRANQPLWRVWSIEQVEQAVSGMAPAEGKPGWLIKIGLFGENLRQFTHFGKWAPTLYTSLLAVKRYLKNAEGFQVS